MPSAIQACLRPSSLRGRLIAWYLLMLGGALATLFAIVFAARARALHRELDAELEITLHEAAARRLPALLSLDPGGTLDEDANAASMALVVRRTSGEVLFRSRAFPELGWAGEREAAAAARGVRSVATVADRAGAPIRLATLLVPRPGAESLAVQVSAPIGSVTKALRKLAVAMVLFGVFVMGLASLGGAVITRRALAPVDEIVRCVRRVQAAHIGDRLDVRAGSEELDRLVATLNEMLGRMETSVRSARRFAADASHELQTPLATMRSALEMCLLDHHGGLDPRGLASDLLLEVEHMSALVRDLRLLALAQGGHLLDGAEPLDLAEVTEESCEIAEVLAEEKRIRVELIGRARPVVRGSALHLRRVLLNLLQNAIRYSPEGSTVRLMIGRARDQAIVSVADHGCGIEPADLAHVFEPFYRADPARARETGGTGLGLAIVDQVVRLHGGFVRVASAPGRGSTFLVYLPLAPPRETPRQASAEEPLERRREPLTPIPEPQPHGLTA